ncbi:MAG: hypothetical protein QOF76_2667 [Solirubrobacteraceae bacterium]|nr:hypothetical protein [Solirubrobacteraceae bacterium]
MAGHAFGGKVALVTGGARGMGRAIALAFANEGASVVITDINGDGARTTISEIEAGGGDGHFIRADVSVPAEVEALIAGTVETYGKLDCAVNNAGVELEAGPLADIEDDVFDRIVAVNLKGVFLCMKVQIRAMVRGDGGTIVNIGSINSLRPQPTGAVYTSTKSALVGLSRSAAQAVLWLSSPKSSYTFGHLLAVDGGYLAR